MRRWPPDGLPQKEYNFTFVNHVTTNPFFTPTVYGIEDACAFFGCSYQWTGSQTSDRRRDGRPPCRRRSPTRWTVSRSAWSTPRRSTQPTDDALSIGIPVIGYNADTTANARLAYVGQSLYQSGYNIAQKWLPMVKPGGKVMLSIATPGSLNLQPRLDGYIQAIKDAGDPVTYETLDSGVDQATEESRIEAYYLANPDVVGMFGTGATDSLAVGKISQKYGLAAAGRHHGRLRPAARDHRARRQRRHDLHHRPAAVPAGLHSHAADLPLPALGRRGLPREHRYQPGLRHQ